MEKRTLFWYKYLKIYFLSLLLNLNLKHIILTFTILFIFNYPSSAQKLSGYFGVFADYPLSARLSALNVRTVASTATEALFSNPAALLATSVKRAEFSYFKIYTLIPNFISSFAIPINSECGIGLGFHTNGDDLLRETSINFGYARRYAFLRKRIDIGCTITIRYASFGNNSTSIGSVSGSAFGAGITCGTRIWLKRNMAFGVVLQNVLNFLQWNTSATGKYSENIPSRLIFGLAVRTISQLTIMSDMEKSVYSETYDKLHMGCEWAPLSLICFRMGYRWSLLYGPEDERMSLGLGIKHTYQSYRFYLDVAYVWEDLPNTLYYTIGLHF